MRLGPGADNDPRRTLGFTYNGQSFGALAGDTLASALMAAGRLELGRGAKTGRPRGLRWLDRASDMRVTSARGSPGNDPATMVVRDRMTIRRLIRVPKAGASASAAIVSTEILVIGGGAAGLIAALTAARAGASVVLVEAQRTWGGALWGSGESIDGRPARAWIADVVDELTRSTKVKLLTGVRIEAKSDMTWKARDIGRLDPEPENFEISARVVIMATGAVERMIGFAGNDLPGVMTASTMRAALYRWGVVPGSRIAVFGVTGEVQQTTQALVKAGLNPVAMINANGPQGGPDGVPAYPGGVVRRAQGDRKLEGITVVHEGETETIACDGLAIAGGWSPSILVPGLDATPIWNAAIAAWLCPPGAVPGLEVAGAAGGSYSTRAAMKSGYFRARRAVSSIGLSAPDLKLPQAIDLPTGGDPLWLVADGDASEIFLDFRRDLNLRAAGRSGALVSSDADIALARSFLANPAGG